MPLASMKRALALVVLRIYPPHWRVRYAAEIGDLIDTRGIGWGGLVDLLWCALEEWTRSDTGRREGPAAAARRLMVALVASLLVSVLTTGVWLLFFLTYVAAVRWWIGADVFWVAGLFLRSGWPYALSLWFAYSAVFALPAIMLCRLTGVGRRWPVIAQLATTAAFVSFTAWLPLAALPHSPYLIKLLIAGTTGWVLAAVLFPARRRSRGVLVPAP